jgi:hypothetical protein
MEQNHQAHIAVHQAAMQDPKIMQLVGQNPQAQAIQAAAMAHLNEHIAFEYRKQMEQRMGIVLPSEDKQKHLKPEQADQIALLAAQAAQQLLQQNKGEAQQQQAQQQMQDPVVQMQMQELQIKQQELQLKAQKQQAETAVKAQQLQIEQARIEAQKQIAAMQVIATTTVAKDKLERQSQLETARLGVDVGKMKAQMQHQRGQAHLNRMTQNRVPRENKE